MCLGHAYCRIPRLRHLPDVAQMVTVVVAEREVVLAVVEVVLPCLAVTLAEQELLFPLRYALGSAAYSSNSES